MKNWKSKNGDLHVVRSWEVRTLLPSLSSSILIHGNSEIASFDLQTQLLHVVQTNI